MKLKCISCVFSIKIKRINGTTYFIIPFKCININVKLCFLLIKTVGKKLARKNKQVNKIYKKMF